MIKQRLLDICNALNISASEMSTTIGMSRPYIANLKKDITTEVLLNIHIKYPSVNIMRIITGEGSVLLENNKVQNANIDSSFSLRNIISLKMKIKLLMEVGELKGEFKKLKTCPRGRQCNMCYCKRIRFGEIEYIINKY